MSKTKSAFFCQSCGYESTKWTGKCPSCNNWNTFVEEVVVKGTDKKEKGDWDNYNGAGKLKTISISEVSSAEEKRIVTTDAEVNRVLGGGIVMGSIGAVTMAALSPAWYPWSIVVLALPSSWLGATFLKQ